MMHYVCADIHGNWEKYQAMLSGLPMGPTDKLYILGDVIDRGPDGIRVLQDIKTRGNIFFFIGNHELLLLGCLYYGVEEMMDLWLQNGGQKTAEAFLCLSSGEQDELLEFLNDSYVVIPDLNIEGQHYYLVHAYPDLHYMGQPVLLSEMIEDSDRLWHMMWERIDKKRWQDDETLQTLWENNRKLMIGHTITTSLCSCNRDLTCRKTAEEGNQLIARLKGKKILLRGNHDRKYDASLFEEICDLKKLRYQHCKFILMHYILQEWDGDTHYSIHLHGHIHSHGAYNRENLKAGFFRYDVGVDANDYRPISLDQLVEIFRNAPHIVKKERYNYDEI